MEDIQVIAAENHIITAKTSSGNEEVQGIPIKLRIEFTDGELAKITATDNADKEYVVSLKLRADDSICCCQLPGGKVICQPMGECNCDPP